MKKLLAAFFFLLSLTLFPFSITSADQTTEVAPPPPPDLDTSIPPPLALTPDKTAEVAAPPPPAIPTTDPTTQDQSKGKADEMAIPAPPDDGTAPSKAEAVVKPVEKSPAPSLSGADNDKSKNPTDEKKADSSPVPTVQTKAEETTPATAKKSPKKSKKSAVTKAKEESKKTAEAAIPQPTEPPQPSPTVVAAAPPGPSMTQLVTAYKYAYELYAAQQFEKARDLFKKIAMVTDEPTLKANSLYYYSQCAFRTEDYIGCVKGLRVLVKKEPDCSAIKKGYVTRFCVFLIDQASNLQTNWDYFRYQVRDDENGNPVWKESIPPGPKIKRINFRLGFGLYNVLHAIQPDSPEDVAAKQKLQKMLDAPITVLWVDEKAAKTKYGHPADFLSLFSTNEKKDFSKVICQRMFFNFETEYFYKFLDMHDDVRNLKPRFVAVNKVVKETANLQALPTPNEASGAITTAISTEEDPNKILTLYNLLHVAGYYHWLDSYSNTIEAAPTDLNL